MSPHSVHRDNNRNVTNSGSIGNLYNDQVQFDQRSYHDNRKPIYTTIAPGGSVTNGDFRGNQFNGLPPYPQDMAWLQSWMLAPAAHPFTQEPAATLMEGPPTGYDSAGHPRSQSAVQAPRDHGAPPPERRPYSEPQTNQPRQFGQYDHTARQSQAGYAHPNPNPAPQPSGPNERPMARNNNHDTPRPVGGDRASPPDPQYPPPRRFGSNNPFAKYVTTQA